MERILEISDNYCQPNVTKVTKVDLSDFTIYIIVSSYSEIAQ